MIYFLYGELLRAYYICAFVYVCTRAVLMDVPDSAFFVRPRRYTARAVFGCGCLHVPHVLSVVLVHEAQYWTVTTWQCL